MSWDDSKIARLKLLWAEGVSMAEIGRRLNCSKNSVTGKVHRLKLEARPSPIKPLSDDDRATRDCAAVPGPRKSAQRAACVVEALVAPVVEREPAVRKMDVPKREAPRMSDYAAPRECCWPIGDPRAPSFRMCGARSAPGRPYCDEHISVAYVRVRDGREDVA